MPEISNPYYVTPASTPEALANNINMTLASISERLDRMDGVRASAGSRFVTKAEMDTSLKSILAAKTAISRGSYLSNNYTLVGDRAYYDNLLEDHNILDAPAGWRDYAVTVPKGPGVMAMICLIVYTTQDTYIAWRFPGIGGNGQGVAYPKANGWFNSYFLEFPIDENGRLSFYFYTSISHFVLSTIGFVNPGIISL